MPVCLAGRLGLFAVEFTESPAEGCNGDRVMTLLPRVPEWWTFAIAAIKIGAVFCPSPCILTPHDLKYRIKQGKFKMIVTDTDNAGKIEEILGECPTLSVKFLMDGGLPGWINYQTELVHPALASTRLIPLVRTVRTKATDLMLIFFLSGTTGDPKMVLHTHAYPLGHVVTGWFWYDLMEWDLNFTVADMGLGSSTGRECRVPVCFCMITAGSLMRWSFCR